MECPDCGGPMWDNRVNKKNPKGPDWKCKSKECQKAVWLKPLGSVPIDQPKSMEPTHQVVKTENGIRIDPPDFNGSIQAHVNHAGDVFDAAWARAGKSMETLMPVKDSQDMKLEMWYDIKMRLAQFIAIQTDRKM